MNEPYIFLEVGLSGADVRPVDVGVRAAEIEAFASGVPLPTRVLEPEESEGQE